MPDATFADLTADERRLLEVVDYWQHGKADALFWAGLGAVPEYCIFATFYTRGVYHANPIAVALRRLTTLHLLERRLGSRLRHGNFALPDGRRLTVRREYQITDGRPEICVEVAVNGEPFCGGVLSGVREYTLTDKGLRALRTPAAQPAGDDERLGKLKPCEKKAYRQRDYGQEHGGDTIDPGPRGDKATYEWLKLHGDADDKPLVVLNTWRRYLREARKTLGKGNPKGTRPHGSSIVHQARV